MSSISNGLTPILSELVTKYITDMPSNSLRLGYETSQVNSSSRQSVEIAEEKFLLHRLLEVAVSVTPEDFPYKEQDVIFVSAMTALKMKNPSFGFELHPYLYNDIVLGVKKFTINTSDYRIGLGENGDYTESILYPTEFLPRYLSAVMWLMET